MSENKLTPLMSQYWSIKSQHTDKILFFRMGDFFEIFHQDAEIAAPILEIVLTARNKKASDIIKMCGVPHRSVAIPVAKLLAAGHKVAICDQVEDPKEAIGLVKRAVTKILSPGMVYDPSTLDELSANYICSYDDESVSFCDISTGEAFYYLLNEKIFENSLENDRNGERRDGKGVSAKASKVWDLIQLLSPAEIVLSQKQKADSFQNVFSKDQVDGFYYSVQEISSELSFAEGLPVSAQRLLSYISYMQGEEARHSIRHFEKRQLAQCLEVPTTATRHLEIFKTYKQETRGSLFRAINRTKTPMGGRKLKQWLRFPLCKEQEINARLDEVEDWFGSPEALRDLRSVFSGMGDLERRIARIRNSNCRPTDFLALAHSLNCGLSVSALCSQIDRESLKPVESLVDRIQKTIVKEPPANTSKGGFIAKGVDDNLDELILFSEQGEQILLKIESRERESTGILNLKIKYNNVFGYFLEVTNSYKAKVPEHYKRKQTLSNAERYITEELVEIEEKILLARGKRLKFELEILSQLRKEVLSLSQELLSLSEEWSHLDVVSSLGFLAQEQNYVRPEFSNEANLKIVSGRHPVVEQEVSIPFVPNTVEFSTGECLMLTGPNMAGKSTIMRQIAITSIMAQMGSFVPARSAQLPVFEQVFTRIGASDFLTEGLSTFMVEMKETAEMLSAVGKKSLVILDEVGRGTSTVDGMSLAQSILEYLLERKTGLVLFATHYHELTKLAEKFSSIKNAHMQILEQNGGIQFLRNLAEGPANKSYGIEVAQLAGLPEKVIARAQAILLEQKNL